CRTVAAEVRRALSDGCVPLVLGGDHSLAAGSVAGAAAHLAARGERLGVVWVDAHADVNTPASSPSGNIHGMPLAHLLGRGDAALTGIAGTTAALRPEDCAVVGVRDLDAPEQRHLKEWGVKTFTMRDIDERGTHAVMDEALETASKHTSGTWLSFDLDVVDPSLAPGVGTPVPGGMTYREAHHVMELVADSHRLVGMDMVEVNPVLDVRNQTADLAAQLILSAFGKRIL
ncbi:MAG: arginase, partial [Gemmatimonadetes bacterium]|nr:arginase [Gemmatimonadota bacterium]